MNIQRLAQLARFDDLKLSKTNVFASEHFFLDVYALRPGQEQKIHAHAKEDKVYVVLSGDVVVRVGSEEEVVVVGEAVMAPRGIEHGIRNASQADATVLVFMAPHPGPR